MSRTLSIKERRTVKKILFFIGLTIILTINYMYNFMDSQNNAFNDFQADSETLVTGIIFADCRELDNMQYGLGRYYTKSGPLLSRYGTNYTYLTDENWTLGYSNYTAQLIFDKNYYTQTYAVEGNFIKFATGEIFPIISSMEDDEYLVVSLASDEPLNVSQYGSLSETAFLDQEGRKLPDSAVEIYKSQYGLQGKVFRFMANSLGMEIQEGDKTVYHLICSVLTGLTFVMLVWLIRIKYGNLLASCFYITFLLSPWVVNFAKNLYWVEFTWFIPMLVGLFCSIYIDNKKWRAISYIAAYTSILIKSLCGYEYISTIMLGMTSFLVTDIIYMLISHTDKRKIGIAFRTFFLTSLFALAGFITAFIIHAYYRGEGIWQGIQYIILEDAIRRTRGIDNTVDVSLWYVLGRYFQFQTEIITGIPGNLFVIICTIPICIFIYEYVTGKINWKDVILYGVFFLTSISWFCLAKNHAYVHTHMNYVLWYFGYIQICIYVIVKRFAKFCKGKA
ncbi:MAG: YfhO family protein [Lachnospiraceae bacterium]|nr:YfhO family protein [Lachnospiraceae bacterium]